MKTRGIIGKRIVRIEQGMARHGETARSPTNSVGWIELEDGTKLIPVVAEGDSCYFVDLVVNTRNRRRKINQNKSCNQQR